MKRLFSAAVAAALFVVCGTAAAQQTIPDHLKAIRAAADAIEKLAATPTTPPVTPPPPPAPGTAIYSPFTGVAKLLNSPDLHVAPFTTPKDIDVTVRLQEPLRRQVAFLCGPSNGSIYAPAFFPSVGQRIDFLPGETEKVIKIRVNRMPTVGQYLVVGCGATQNSPPVTGSVNMKVIASNTPSPPIAPNPWPAPVYPPVRGTQGRTLVQDFHMAGPRTTGSTPNTLRTYFPWGNWQQGNSERAAYADASRDPGTNPHRIVNGDDLQLVAEHVPTTVQVSGATVTLPFSAPLINTANFPGIRNAYIEARIAIDNRQGLIPAFWMMPKNGARFPEFDIFEDNLGDIGVLVSSAHTQGFGGESLRLVNSTADKAFHVYGFEIDDEWLVTLIDGKEVHRRKNPMPGREMYLIANIAVGGLAPEPRGTTPGQVLGTMTIDYIRVWE